jgi:hypothetical protein
MLTPTHANFWGAPITHCEGLFLLKNKKTRSPSGLKEEASERLFLGRETFNVN